MSRKKPRSPGVSLGNRAAGFHRYADEIGVDGGKAKEHRRIRRLLQIETRRIVAEETQTGVDTVVAVVPKTDV